MNQFSLIEEHLGDDTFKMSLVKWLSAIGGTHLNSVVHEVMNSVLASQLAVQFSFFGKKLKKSFTSKLYPVVLGKFFRVNQCFFFVIGSGFHLKAVGFLFVNSVGFRNSNFYQDINIFCIEDLN